MTTPERIYEVAIIGGGISGTSDFHVIGNYTNIESAILIDKEQWWGQITSNSTSNAQSLHRGYIETNFSPEKTVHLKEDAGWTQGFVERHSDIKGLARQLNSIVIGVGADEVKALEERYSWAKEIFPDLSLIGPERLREIEPMVMKGRDPNVPIVALYTPNGYKVDYSKLSETLVETTQRNNPKKTLDTILNDRAMCIERTEHGTYRIPLSSGRTIEAKGVMVSAGTHSLAFAHELGYGKNLMELTIAGHFVHVVKKLRNSMIYTVQKPGVPFAAPHLDEDVVAEDFDRGGPTAMFYPFMEPYKGRPWDSFKSFLEYRRTVRQPFKAFRQTLQILNEDQSTFLKQQLRFHGPNGLRNYLPQMQKIIPTLKIEEMTWALDENGHFLGGIRPQVIDRTAGEMIMREVKIVGDEHDNLLFNVTPSPGASVGIATAMKDASQPMMKRIRPDYVFDEERFRRDHMPSR